MKRYGQRVAAFIMVFVVIFSLIDKNTIIASDISNENVNQGLTVDLIYAKDSEDKDVVVSPTGKPNYITVNTTNSSPNTSIPRKVKIDLTMEDGCVLATFKKNDGTYWDKLKLGPDDNSLEISLIKDENGNPKYLTYEVKPGYTGSFELEFYYPNGTGKNNSKVKVTPSVIGEKQPEDNIGSEKELIWTSDFDWNDVEKTVDRNVCEVQQDNTLANDLIYTIRNSSNNKNEFGDIWTKEVTDM